MSGVITKLTVFKCPVELYRLGGIRLILAVLLARRGTPFLTIYSRFMWS